MRHRSLVASPSLFPRLSNFACTFLQKHLHPLPVNAFRIIEIHQQQPVLECIQKICNGCLPVQGSTSNLFQSVLPLDNGPMLPLEKHRHPYLFPLVECTKVGLPHPFGKLLQGELRLLQANWGFAICTAQVRRIVTLISCIIFVLWHIRQWWQVRNPCNICFQRFRWQLESFGQEAYMVSPRCAERRLRWRSRAARCWLIDWMISLRSWRHSLCTWRWWPSSCELWRGEHFRPAITTLVQVISLPQWSITWISLACAPCRLQTVCYIEWRLVIKLWSAWKWLLWRRATVPLRRMILIGVFPQLTVLASGMPWTVTRWFWIVITALLRAK